MCQFNIYVYIFNKVQVETLNRIDPILINVNNIYALLGKTR